VVKRSAHIAGSLTVLVMVFSWLALSNHCVLGAALPEDKMQQEECPFHSSKAPAKPKQSTDSPCCKILRAIVAKPVKQSPRIAIDLAPSDLLFAAFVVYAPAKTSLTGRALDTGPPHPLSFAELILQRSLFSHAPPFVG
jgi:hypothetical protein